MPDILSKFMHIWEIETHFKCPVVGTMLSIDKHRNILKKCGYNVKNMKPYEYHQQIMAKLNDKNNVSVKVNNFIRHKAHKLMHQIHDLPDRKIRSLWKEHLEAGNVGSILYAIISYEKTGIELLHDVFGEVHMQAHANMTEIFQIRRKLVQADKNSIKLKNKVTLKNREFKKILEERKSDTQKLSLLQGENLRLKTRVDGFENRFHIEKKSENIKKSFEEKVAKQEQHISSIQEKMRVMEREKKMIQVDLFSSQNENKLMKKEFESLIDRFGSYRTPDCPNENHCTKEACPQYKLCAKRIFMIGGITKMKSFYRNVIENAGGKFDYHDGYLKSGKTLLEAKVKRCDIVVCPVNCNSHNACLRVKKLCHKHNRSVKFLHSSSLSAVAQALLVPEKEAAAN